MSRALLRGGYLMFIILWPNCIVQHGVKAETRRVDRRLARYFWKW